MVSHILSCFVTLVWCSFVSANPKDFFQLCKRNDPGLSQCAYHAMKDNIQNFVVGIPELHLTPSDPFLVEKLEKKTEGLTFTLTNLNLTGGRYVEMYPDKFAVESDFSWVNYTAFDKQMNLHSDYSLERPGKPTKTGKAIFTFDDVNMDISIGFEFYDKDGEEYLRCNNFIFMMIPSGSKTHLEGITDGLDEDLVSVFGNPAVFFGEMLGKGLENEFKEYVNRAIPRYPAKEWFLA